MTYADNKQCVELLGGRFPGIFAMLHDELSIPGGSDNSFLDKIKREHQKHPFFGDGTNKVVRHIHMSHDRAEIAINL